MDRFKRNIAVRLKEAIDSHNFQAVDIRPVSGNVGQKGIGYIVDKSGRMFKIVKQERTDDFVGPGTYDPYKYDRKNIRGKISNYSKRFDFTKCETSKGPADYCYRPSPSRRQHLITGRRTNNDVPFLSGNMCHEPWVKNKSKKHIPRNRFPMKNFEKTSESSCFASKVKRDVFSNMISETPDPGSYQIETKFVRDHVRESNSIFGGRGELFADRSDTPGPGHYHQPLKPSGPMFGMERLMESEVTEKDITPGPGHYDLETKPKKYMGKHPIFANSLPREKPLPPSVDYYSSLDNELQNTIPRQIMSKDPKRGNWFGEIRSSTPGPASYNIKRDLLSGRGSLIDKNGGNLRYGFLTTDKRIDSHLAYTTLHDGFIKKSYNARYSSLK